MARCVSKPLNEEMVKTIINDWEGMTIKGLSNKLGISPARINRIVKQLREEYEGENGTQICSPKSLKGTEKVIERAVKSLKLRKKG